MGEACDSPEKISLPVWPVGFFGLLGPRLAAGFGWTQYQLAHVFRGPERVTFDLQVPWEQVRPVLRTAHSNGPENAHGHALADGPLNAHGSLNRACAMAWTASPQSKFNSYLWQMLLTFAGVIEVDMVPS